MKAAINTLMEAMKNKNWNIRQIAAEALGKIGGKRAVDVLIEVIRKNDENWRVRYTAANALGRIGRIGDEKIIDYAPSLHAPPSFAI